MIVVRGVRGLRGTLSLSNTPSLNQVINAQPPPPAAPPANAAMTVPSSLLTAIAPKTLMAAISPYVAPMAPSTMKMPSTTFNGSAPLAPIQYQTPKPATPYDTALDFNKNASYPVAVTNPVLQFDQVQKQTSTQTNATNYVLDEKSAYMGPQQSPAAISLPTATNGGMFVPSGASPVGDVIDAPPPVGTPMSPGEGTINGQTLDQHKAAAAADGSLQKADFSCFGTWWCPAIIAGVVVGAGWLLLRKKRR